MIGGRSSNKRKWIWPRITEKFTSVLALYGPYQITMSTWELKDTSGNSKFGNYWVNVSRDPTV